MIRPRSTTFGLSFGVTGIATDIEYEDVGRLLAASQLDPSVSEAHGMLCGFICGRDIDPVESWLNQLLPAVSANGPASLEARDALASLAVATLDETDGRAIGLTLWLPSDDRPLAERATALYDWVRGFLFAMGVLGIAEGDLTEQGREIIRDFADLTRLDFDCLEESEDNEQALAEVLEFIRVASLLILEEQIGPRSEAAPT